MSYLTETGSPFRVPTSLKWGSPELFRQLGDVPLSSLCLVEGENATGKSILLQQLAWAALKEVGLRISYFTTECASRVLLNQFQSLSFFVAPFFVSGHLRIHELHTRKLKWQAETADHLISILSKYMSHMNTDVIIIDSLTHLVAEAGEKNVLDFFTMCRKYTGGSNKTIFISLHPFAVKNEILSRIRSICDGHIVLAIKEHRGKSQRTIYISKMRGATKSQEKIVAFDVDAAYGIKPIAFSTAKA
ncbi:MAG: hypothetical protein HYU39_06600 [Thaumarchaeota archaeon]|nr:hypothetical protein [Nitrososphaerota archaeon]